MLLYRLKRYAPSANGVALLALAAELTLVEIGVTIGAFAAHIGEYQFQMALPAID